MALTQIKASNITDGTIVAAEIADDGITTAKIADDAVTAAKIADAVELGGPSLEHQVLLEQMQILLVRI